MTDLGWFIGSRPWWHDEVRIQIEDSYDGDILPSVVLLSADGVIVDGAAIGQRSGRSDSFRKKVRFTDWVPFGGFDIRSAIGGLRGISLSTARATVGASIGSFTPTATAAILTWLETHNHDARAAIGGLLGRGQLPDWLADPGAAGHVPYYDQHDGLQVGLELARFDRNVVLERLEHPETPDDLPLASLVEDQIVANDTWTFLDWERFPHVVAGAVFEEPSTGRRLRTFLANKLPVEHQTGADIVYYMEDLNSFVLVQYKRCRREGGKLVYRPDDQYEKAARQLARLQELAAGKTSSHLLGHRLGEPFCFFKLCEPDQALGSSISKGKYFDLRGFELSFTKGERGGRRVLYDATDRYITNTLFVDLVTQGWVGSSGDVSELVLKTLETSFKNDRSVLLASVRFGSGSIRGGTRATNIRINARQFRAKT